MYRNRELFYYILVQVIIIALFSMYGLRGNITSNTLLFMGAIFLLINISFMSYRYKKIRELNDYLQRIQNREFALDIRDNKEGELSILKNEIYKITKMLSTQAELLERDKRYLADSISDISHQLKTPLTSMLMMVELLENESMPIQKRQEFINNIMIGLERMEWLIQSLLKLSKLDADAVIFNKTRINIKVLIHNCIQLIQPIIEAKGVDVLVKDGKEDMYIIGDYSWLLEAFSNVIKNCIEHTKSDRVSEVASIQITMYQNNLYSKIIISDNGSGIEKEDIPYIFNRFYKGKNSKPDSVGIGLALAKQIISKQKGTIEVSSTLGVGTTFEIKLFS